MRILVTGAQGCIGAWIVKKLLDRGLDVVSYDIDATPRRLGLIATADQIGRLTTKVGHIEDTQSVKALVRDEGITNIVHLAAQLMPFCQVNPVAGGMINVIGTLNVFEAARDAGRPVRIVYASSAAVWGPPDMYGDKVLTEEDPIEPSTHYGVFKQSNEMNARVFYTTNGLSSVGLRPWTVYGVGRDSGLTADPTLAIRAVALNQPFKIRLSGYMDFQYVEDVAEAFIGCALSEIEGAHIFNMAGEVSRIEEFISRLAALAPETASLITADGPQVPVAYRMSDGLLLEKVPDIPKTPLEEGIARTLDIFRRLRRENRLQPN